MRSAGAFAVLGLALGGGASGCALRAPAAAPDAELTPAPGAARIAPEAETPPADWWTAFGSPELDRVVARALDRNLTLRGAAARLARAAADAETALGGLYPQVEAGASALAERRNFIGLPIPGFAEGEIPTAEYAAYGLSLGLFWEANLWREAAPRARAAAAGLEAALADAAGARVSLAGQVVRLYFLAVEAREQARLAEEAVDRAGEALTHARRRARLGKEPLSAVHAAEARLAEARAAAAERRRARAAAVRSLEVLLREYPDGAPGPDWELGERLPGNLDPPPAGVPADLISRRPDVAGAERRLAASREFTAAARRARYPSFRLTSAVGTSTDRLRQLVNGDFSVWSLLANLAAPVFSGGRIRAAIRREEAADREATAAYAAAALTAYQEVEAGLAAEEALREMEVEAAAALAAERRSLRRAREGWRNGFVARGEVFRAEGAAGRAESRLLARARARLDNRVNLYLALGGGFEWDSDPEGAPEGERTAAERVSGAAPGAVRPEADR